jgi:hypothetical protein
MDSPKPSAANDAAAPESLPPAIARERYFNR